MAEVLKFDIKSVRGDPCSSADDRGVVVERIALLVAIPHLLVEY